MPSGAPSSAGGSRACPRRTWIRGIAGQLGSDGATARTMQPTDGAHEPPTRVGVGMVTPIRANVETYTQSYFALSGFTSPGLGPEVDLSSTPGRHAAASHSASRALGGGAAPRRTRSPRDRMTIAAALSRCQELWQSAQSLRRHDGWCIAPPHWGHSLEVPLAFTRSTVVSDL